MRGKSSNSSGTELVFTRRHLPAVKRWRLTPCVQDRLDSLIGPECGPRRQSHGMTGRRRQAKFL
jgi:hypothetical protein